jgi:YD repeat-containing protein
MSLSKTYVRDGKRKIIASITDGFSDDTHIVRDADNRILGKVNHRFRNTRDAHGRLVSIDTPDAGLLIGGDDE